MKCSLADTVNAMITAVNEWMVNYVEVSNEEFVSLSLMRHRVFHWYAYKNSCISIRVNQRLGNILVIWGSIRQLKMFFFVKVVKLTNHAERWDAEFALYSPSATPWICKEIGKVNSYYGRKWNQWQFFFFLRFTEYQWNLECHKFLFSTANNA